jgi:hypothetical protein
LAFFRRDISLTTREGSRNDKKYYFKFNLMKKLQQFILAAALLISFAGCAAPIKNAKTETFRVAGNCDMCKSTIETAAARKGLAEATWNKDSKLLSLTYDSEKTSSKEVLQRVAYAGYDNEQFLAPDDVYAKLPECCRYDRLKKETASAPVVSGHEHHSSESQSSEPQNPQETGKNALTDVYASYFATKDALVKDDGSAASSKAAALEKAIKAVDMGKMSSEQHTAWMKAEKSLLAHAGQIAGTKEIERQREHFAALSKDLYPVVKIFKADQTLYYQHCPMYNDGQGADWLSKENAVKNPYYGSSMLTCGKTTETIK